LGIRLTVNIITGHTLIKVLNGFILLPGIGLLVVPLLVLPLILELLIGYLIATITLKDFAIGSLLLHIGIEDNF
jgi:hypothetical protein